MYAVVATLLAASLALFGVVVGAWFQLRNWHHQNHVRTRKEQKDAALAVVQDLAKLMDRRLYRQRRYLGALRRRSDTSKMDEAREAYNEILFEWNDNLGRFKASLGAYFEGYEYHALEKLHEEFQSIGENLELFDRSGSVIEPISVSNHRLNALGRKTYEWIMRLLNEVNGDQLQGYLTPHLVRHSNWDSLSSAYLLKRLFGLARQS